MEPKSVLGLEFVTLLKLKKVFFFQTKTAVQMVDQALLPSTQGSLLHLFMI